jgi:hypothetical protein
LLTLFHTKTYAAALNRLIQNPAANVLIIYGSQDEFTGETSYDAWRNELEGVNGEGLLRVVKVENATHFWRGRSAEELRLVITQWLPSSAMPA